MARKVTTTVLCDVCLEEDQGEVEGTETPAIVLGSMKPRILGLCETHMKEYDHFKHLVQDLGQPVPDGGPLASVKVRPAGTSAGSGVWPCPDPSCPKHLAPYGHQQSLRNHAREVHDMTVPQLRAAFDGQGQEYLPLEPGTAKEPKVKEAECPECGTVYAWPQYTMPVRVLGVHRAKVHGVRGKKHGTSDQVEA